MKLAQQRPDFDAALRAALSAQPALPAGTPAGNVRLDQIYEYCIQRVVRKQAEGFYKDFPLTDAIDGLVNDYCRMEEFRRRDDFACFSLSVYQQIREFGIRKVYKKLVISPLFCNFIFENQ